MEKTAKTIILPAILWVIVYFQRFFTVNSDGRTIKYEGDVHCMTVNKKKNLYWKKKNHRVNERNWVQHTEHAQYDWRVVKGGRRGRGGGRERERERGDRKRELAIKFK